MPPEPPYKMRHRLLAPTNEEIGSGSEAALKVATPGGSGSVTQVQNECKCDALIHIHR